MKILHLLYESEGDYFGTGGVAARAYEIYGRLKDRHDITLLCRRYPGAENGMIRGLRHLFAGSEGRSFTKALLSYAFAASRFVRRHGVDFDIIVEEFSPAIPTFLNFYKKRPLVLQVQGYTGGLYFRKYNPLSASALFLMERLRPRFYTSFVFTGDETVRRLLPGNRKSVAIIPNGVSREILGAVPEEGGYILYLGRIDIYGKGLDILLEAYREFHRSFPGMGLKIAGDGRDMARFKSMIEDLPGAARKGIELPGWVTGAEKTELFRRASFVVFPSRHETQGITALEAMACGKAVVCSDIPELRYVVTSGAGIAFRSGDALSLLSAMKDMAERKDRSLLGQKGKEYVEGYTWEKIVLRYEEFLKEVVEEYRVAAKTTEDPARAKTQRRKERRK